MNDSNDVFKTIEKRVNVVSNHGCNLFKAKSKVFRFKEDFTGNEIQIYINPDGHILIDRILIKNLDY